MHSEEDRPSSALSAFIILVPTLCVGTQVGTLCVPKPEWPLSRSRLDAERPHVGSHAERGNQEKISVFFVFLCVFVVSLSYD